MDLLFRCLTEVEGQGAGVVELRAVKLAKKRCSEGDERTFEATRFAESAWTAHRRTSLEL